MPPERTNWTPVKNRSYESPYLNDNNCPNTMINPHTGAPDPSGVAQSVFTWTESGSPNTHSICSTSCQTDSDCPRSSNSFNQQIPGRCTWGLNSPSPSEGVCMPNITTAFNNILGRDLPVGAQQDYANMVQLSINAYILGLVRNYYVVGQGGRVDNTVSQARAQSQVREIIFSGVYDEEIQRLNDFARFWGSTLYPSYQWEGINLTTDILGFLHEFGLNWSITKNTTLAKHNNLNICPFGSVMTPARSEFPNTCFSTTHPGIEVPPECRQNSRSACEAQQGCTWGVNLSIPGVCVHQPQRCVNVKKAHTPFLDPLCPYLPSGSCKGSKVGCDTITCSSLPVDQCYPSMEQSESKGCCYLEPIL